MNIESNREMGCPNEMVKLIRHKLIKNCFKIYRSRLIPEIVEEAVNNIDFDDEAEIPEEDHVNLVLTESCKSSRLINDKGKIKQGDIISMRGNSMQLCAPF
ncbi:unnamed protein product [Moneuplotes crassus]|uniref:Uncharacterized protein n=1 Tax=Euplotes crassus TaxID=5936 RepID=A0AAD1XDP0_EUPCR|nr:unnamed protein product [Moneuplotes crassus]